MTSETFVNLNGHMLEGRRSISSGFLTSRLIKYAVLNMSVSSVLDETPCHIHCSLLFHKKQQSLNY